MIWFLMWLVLDVTAMIGAGIMWLGISAYLWVTRGYASLQCLLPRGGGRSCRYHYISPCPIHGQVPMVPIRRTGPDERIDS